MIMKTLTSNVSTLKALSVKYFKSILSVGAPAFQITGASYLAYLIGFKYMFYLLALAMVIDFLTAFIAYCINNSVKFNPFKGQWALQSDLLKRNLLKLLIYLFVILFMGAFEMIFFKINIKQLNELVDRPLNGVAIVTLCCTLVEVLSILENFKKMGFDIIGKLKNALDKIKDLKKQIKELF